MVIALFLWHHMLLVLMSTNFSKYFVIMSDILCKKIVHLLCEGNSISFIPCVATKVGGLMHLASMAIPPNLSASAVLRTACLLTRMIANQGAENSDTPLAFHKAAVCHAFLLLLISVELQDKRSK
jgi:hypothetical protein